MLEIEKLSSFLYTLHALFHTHNSTAAFFLQSNYTQCSIGVSKCCNCADNLFLIYSIRGSLYLLIFNRKTFIGNLYIFIINKLKNFVK